MRFAFPARLADIDQFQVDLVHQRGGLQRMLFALAPDEGAISCREAPGRRGVRA